MNHFGISAEMPSPGSPLFLDGLHAVVLFRGIPPFASCSISSAATFALQVPITKKKCGYFTSKLSENSDGTSDYLLLVTGTRSDVPRDRMVKSLYCSKTLLSKNHRTAIVSCGAGPCCFPARPSGSLHRSFQPRRPLSSHSVRPQRWRYGLYAPFILLTAGHPEDTPYNSWT